MLARHGLVDGPDDDRHYSDERQVVPSIDFLPRDLWFSKSDLTVRIRSARKSDDRLLFQMIDDVSRTGSGIALNDVPNLAFFRREVMLDGYTVVFEDVSNLNGGSGDGKVIGWSQWCDSWITRSPASAYCDWATVLTSEYQVSE